ncbi:hypothetical protein HYPSUDRAFT_178205 [Hypholoma sublateritium FD-334 SS-4]|uniref:ZW10 C-terminal helical domain-containing protein n=1 Tax=Hypholoma sublateritium (strain FD-334 SS-4) TaxID=945553 RepID=A0A0D2PHS8_HYPSF|nr:hypothetical protein HYPSUDRAFT_178205 [Hypholoma sublateritium FD-334 SS-4]
MAFPVPEHLPKRAIPIDVSSKILYKIDAATKDALNSSLASSWIGELDESIQATKQRIHDRIQSDLPTFNSQFEISKSIQARYESLKTRVDDLDSAISDPDEGLVHTLVKTLNVHSTLAQEASDTTAAYEGLSYLLKCRKSYAAVVTFGQSGNLPEAVIASREVDALLAKMPEFLQQTKVSSDLKNKFNVTKAWIQDQLSDAFPRSIIISPTEITVFTPIEVRGSGTMLQLSAILHSMSAPSLANHLAILRRDVLLYFVDHVLNQPYTLSIKPPTEKEARLSLIPAPPNNEDLSSRLNNVSIILGFLSKHIFPHLPSDESTQLKRSLSKPVTTSVLNNLLMPALPSSFGLLPAYLNLLKRAVRFEGDDVVHLLECDASDGPIKAWSDGVSGHYERRRRVEILEHARTEIMKPHDPNDTFDAFNEGGPETSLPSIVPFQVDEEDYKDDAWGLDEPATANGMDETADGWGLEDTVSTPMEESKDSWGLDETTSLTPVDSSMDGWGFEDDIEPEPGTTEPQLQREPAAMHVDLVDAANGKMEETEPDPADAWGWKEDGDLPAEEIPEDNVWDDPWANFPEVETIPERSPPLVSLATSVVSPKAATRLEKLASKNKKHLNGHSSTSSTPASSPVPPLEPRVLVTPSSPERSDHNPPPKSSRLNPGKRLADVITTSMPQETYKVPKGTKHIIKMVEIVIDESKLFFASQLFDSVSKDVSSPPGTVLVQAASSILNLYQALYPVKFAEELKLPERAMLFANSCLYMAGAVQRVEDTIYGQPTLKGKLTECRHRLQILGNSWFEDTVEKQCAEIDTILVAGAQGFTYTGDQDRYDECEMAVNETLKAIKRVAHRLKGILTKSKYYSTIGLLVETALSRILRDVLSLPDIPEIESHRLSELCRILNSTEGLFSEDAGQPSFVVAYVPSWLKFSYLSELLEASLVDITYLFEQGALVDFQVDELVPLVRALFADTPLRANTISKILALKPMSP